MICYVVHFVWGPYSMTHRKWTSIDHATQVLGVHILDTSQESQDVFDWISLLLSKV